MEAKKFFSLFKESFTDLFKNPLIFIPAFFLWLFLFLFSKISVFINQRLTNSIMLTIWIVFFYLIYLAILAFFFSGLIGMASRKIKFRLNYFLPLARKFFITNLLNIIIIALITILIGRIAHYAALYIGLFLKLKLQTAQLIFILVYFVLLVGILIFFTFSIFLAVMKNIKIKQSIKNSFSLVKKEYLATLTLNVLLFVLFFIFNRLLSGIYADLIENLILIPYFGILFTKFVFLAEKP